jgi:hypothetical protein
MYAAGDLQLCYLRRQGRVVARSIVWPEKKIFNVIYGDTARLSDLLRKEGYKQGIPFGARLLRQKFKHDGKKFTFIAPHVDGSSLMLDDGEFLLVGNPEKTKDKQEGLNTPGGTGHTEMCGFECVHCKKDSFAQRQIVAVMADDKDAAALCQACAKANTVTCAHTGSAIYKEFATQVGKRYFWNRILHEVTFRCAGSGELHPVSDMVRMPDGQMWSKSWAAKNARVCKCGAHVPFRDGCDGSDCLFKRPTLKSTIISPLSERLAKRTGERA